MVDSERYASIGASLRVEADKALHKSLLFAVILVLAHLLDIRPSELDVSGLKIAFRDASVIYGTLALIFGYYVSRAASRSEIGEALLPIQPNLYRMRSNIRLVRRMSKVRKSPKRVKSDVKGNIVFLNVILLPYRVISVTFVGVAVLFSLHDIYNFADFIWHNSSVVAAMYNKL